MSNRNSFVRVSRNKPCLICGKPDWCLVARDGSAAICARVESGRRVQRPGRDQAGWLHILIEQQRQTHRTFRPVPVSDELVVTINWSALTVGCCKALTEDELVRLARSLGLSTDSLIRLNIGWHAATRSYSFPMKDDAGYIVGVRLRRRDGSKFAVKGSRGGLFIPVGLRLDQQLDDTLYIAEGPTDTAALFDMGLTAVGRPSCTGGVATLTSLVKRLAMKAVVIVADDDKPGKNGAKVLATALSLHVPTVRVITPPAGIRDARAWRIAGAAQADVIAAVEVASTSRLQITLSQRKATV